MIIAGFRPQDPTEVARQLRERMARTGEVGEPRSGENPTSESQQDDGPSTEGPPVQEDDAAN